MKVPEVKPMEKPCKGHLHHLELYVRDLTQSSAFWGWLLTYLGYEEYQRWDQGVSYRLEQSYVVFVQTQEAFLKEGYHRCRIGMNHVAFYGGSAADVDALAQLLKQRGVTLLYEERYPYAGGNDHYALYFEDPDRIKVEIVAHD